MFKAQGVNVSEQKTMALPAYPMPKPSSGATPPKSRVKLSRSQSLNLHDARIRSPGERLQDGREFQNLDKTDGTRTLPPHMRKTTRDMKHKDSRPRSEFSAKVKSLFRRKSTKAPRGGGSDASDVTGVGGLPVTASEEQCESGSGLPTQAFNLGFSRHLMTTVMFDQNKVGVSHTPKTHSSHRSTQWYDGGEGEAENVQCCESEETVPPTQNENEQANNEEEIRLWPISNEESGGSGEAGGGGDDSSPHSSSTSQLFTISEECVEEDLTVNSPQLPGVCSPEEVEACMSTPMVILRRGIASLDSDDLLNRWSIAGSGIHDSPSLKESVVRDMWHEPRHSNPNVEALGRDSDSGEDSSNDVSKDSTPGEAEVPGEDSRNHGSSDSVLCDSDDLRMNTSQSMLELPRCVAEDVPRVARGTGLRRSASLTLGRSQKLVLQVYSPCS